MGYSTPVFDTLVKKPKAQKPAGARQPRRRRDRRTEPPQAYTGRPGLLGGLREKRLVRAAALFLVTVALVAAAAPLLSPHDVDAIDMANRLLPPSPVHPFGTDDLGRDVFLRVMVGGRISIAVAVAAVFVALVIGVVGGGAAGYYGGLAGAAVMRAVDVMMSIPVFLIVLLCASLFSPGFVLLCVLIGSIQWMEVARVVRSVVVSTKEHEFVQAARALGIPERRILLRHVLPHTYGAVFVAATLGFAQAVMIESTLSFLGFGVQPPAVSWGGLLRNAQGQLASAPWMAFFPGLMIFLTLFCCYVLGDSLKSVTGRRAAQPPLG